MRLGKQKKLQQIEYFEGIIVVRKLTYPYLRGKPNKGQEKGQADLTGRQNKEEEKSWRRELRNEKGRREDTGTSHPTTYQAME